MEEIGLQSTVEGLALDWNRLSSCISSRDKKGASGCRCQLVMDWEEES